MSSSRSHCASDKFVSFSNSFILFQRCANLHDCCGGKNQVNDHSLAVRWEMDSIVPSIQMFEINNRLFSQTNIQKKVQQKKWKRRETIILIVGLNGELELDLLAGEFAIDGRECVDFVPDVGLLRAVQMHLKQTKLFRVLVKVVHCWKIYGCVKGGHKAMERVDCSISKWWVVWVKHF